MELIVMEWFNQFLASLGFVSILQLKKKKVKSEKVSAQDTLFSTGVFYFKKIEK